MDKFEIRILPISATLIRVLINDFKVTVHQSYGNYISYKWSHEPYKLLNNLIPDKEKNKKKDRQFFNWHNGIKGTDN